MTDTLFNDISEWQNPLPASYPLRVVSIRSNDGDYEDHKFPENLAMAKRLADEGHLTCFIVYYVFRPGIDSVSVLKRMVGTPHPKMAVMIDLESWGGQIRGNWSGALNAEREALIKWLGGNRDRVVGYGNVGDLNSLWPQRGDVKLIVAAYGSNPPFPGKIAHQFSSSYPTTSFGACDINSADGMSPEEFALALGIGADPNPAIIPPPPRPDRLIPGQTLKRGQSVTSLDGNTRLCFQSDSNVVLYHGGKAMWQTRTYGSKADRLAMQGDGNLVLYRGAKALWATYTNRHPGAHLTVQSDCNLVIYYGPRPIWATHTEAK